MAAALTVAAIALAPAGRRRAAAAWWFVPALLGGGYWYLRNLIAVGNPLPQVEPPRPALAAPSRAPADGRPDFAIVHYATDTGVWSDYFGPGLHEAFGGLWPLVSLAAIAGGGAGARAGAATGPRAGSAAPPLRHARLPVHPAQRRRRGGRARSASRSTSASRSRRCSLGLALLPLAAASRRAGAASGPCSRRCSSLLVITDRSDAVLRDPGAPLRHRPGAARWSLVPAALLCAAERRGAARAAALAAGFAALALAVVAIGYPVQRDYLGDRFRNDVPPTNGFPAMHLDSAYRWARDVRDARIGLAGTTAGFLGYGFYGTDLSNRVVYLGDEGPTGPSTRSAPAAASAPPSTTPTSTTSSPRPSSTSSTSDRPLPSPEARWLRGDAGGAEPVERSGDRSRSGG